MVRIPTSYTKGVGSDLALCHDDTNEPKFGVLSSDTDNDRTEQVFFGKSRGKPDRKRYLSLKVDRFGNQNRYATSSGTGKVATRQGPLSFCRF